MCRFSTIAVVLLAGSAFATGERLVLTGSASLLRETLCISMACDAGGARDFVVHGKAVKGGIEFTVVSARGQVCLTHVATVKADGAIGSTDLVHATALVVDSIEKGPVATAAVAPAPKKKAARARKPMKAAVAKR
jgi:hypothetical protein